MKLLKQIAWSLSTVRGVPISIAPKLVLKNRSNGPVHVFICIADHYEPYWGHAAKELAHERVDRWVSNYPTLTEGLRDSVGQIPQHSFFYPAEEYDAALLDKIAGMCRRGFGDVDVHLHHDNDTPDGFRNKLSTFTDSLYFKHGLLERRADGRISYGFIHGNWALNNARPDGRWCGVNNEIKILNETGCYADLTLPCAPSPGQTRMVNSIYYAVGNSRRPKSHDWGTLARVGAFGPSDGLLMIQGPLAWNLKSRKWGLIPRLENGDLHGRNGPSLSRLRRWLNAGIGVAGQPDWVFVKLHSARRHGSQFRTILWRTCSAVSFGSIRICQDQSRVSLLLCNRA